MARGGVNKAVVERARQALISKGMYPSIDAVRVELGNTGSKTTIARCLRELDAHVPSQMSSGERMGDELKALVQSLLDRIMEQGAEVVTEARADFDRQRGAWEARTLALEAELKAVRQQSESQHAALTEQSAQLQTTHSSWQSELTRNARLSQQCRDLELRVEDKDLQIQSLEEKHVHARGALEHYREAIKEQREQDQRRHEAQLQQLQLEQRKLQESLVIKQDESTRLNRDNERLLGELRQQGRALAEQQDLGQRLATELRAAQMACARAEGVREQLQEQLMVVKAQAKSQADAVALASERLAHASERAALLSQENESLLVRLEAAAARAEHAAAHVADAPADHT